jgi:hypothetical protein
MTIATMLWCYASVAHSVAWMYMQHVLFVLRCLGPEQARGMLSWHVACAVYV